MCSSPETIAPRLEKRATYGAAVQELTAALSSASQADQVHRLLPLVSRTHVLVKTRYSGNGQWSAALKCFEAALQACRSHMHDSSVTAFLEPLGGYTKGAQEFLGLQEDTPMEGASTGASTQQHESLLDLLFQPPMPQEVASHYDDAGPILPEDVERLHRAQGPAASTSTSAPIHSTTNQPSAPSTDANRSPSESTGAPHAAESEQQRRARERVALQAAIMEGVQAIYSGMEAVTRGTEAVERELDSLLEALAARTPQPPSKPPASKKAVANLPQVVLTAGKLDEVGRDTTCAICTEVLQEGDTVQLLPCKHAYHEPCVRPWFAQNNSCPVCRQELPTDDPAYEAAKERAVEEEEERRGAANAVSTLEHMYI